METTVNDLLDKYLGNTGKLVRPQLINLFGDIFHLAPKEVSLISRAAEMIHNASLIHDDVIDEAETRRGKKSLNRIVTNSQAVLAGDFLLAKVIGELLEAGQFEILKTLAQTLQSIVEGEFLQDQLKTKQNISMNDLTEVAQKKTGALLSWCCSATAIVGKKDETTIVNCQNIGSKMGEIFQLIDDNLDYSQNTGKEYGKDLKEGLINTTTLQIMTLYPELYYPIYQLRGTQYDKVPWSDEQLQHAKKSIETKAEEIMKEIISLIDSFEETNTSSIIYFMNLLISRKK